MNNPYILLVEDNPADVQLTIRAFQKSNILNEIVVARDGVEALETLEARANDDLPQIILLDLKLPRLDGHQVLERLRGNERTRLLPVVVLTTSSEEDDVAKAYSNGANSYVRKPVDFAQFLEAVKKIGVYWLALNQGPPKPRD